MRESEEPTRPRIVIVGAGFGGLRAARRLSRAKVAVTLVDQRNYHLFQPLLYQVATSMLPPESIAYPVRAILRGQTNLEFRLARVESVDFAKRELGTSAGPIGYDRLVLAVGGRTNFFGLASVERNGFGLKDLDEAVNVRNQILRSFERALHEPSPERRRAYLTFVVVGGGPTGVESAGALSELVRLVLAKDFHALEIKDVRVILLEATHALLGPLPEKLREATAQRLWRKHVEVRFGAQVVEFDGDRVQLSGGEVIPARTLIWAAGARAASLIDRLGLPQGAQGRVRIDETLRVLDHQDVFAIGDAAFLEHAGQPLPMMAPVAMQQGELVARNVLRSLAGEPLEPFAYRNPGSLATIGRHAAVAHLGRFAFTGFFAWLLWLAVHVAQLIGFRNKLLVLVEWGWEYFTYERAVRLITADQVRERGD
ncbi:MAG: NAD(P)/FAD-dependent oxidoreductase [Myxococcota bacterium]